MKTVKLLITTTFRKVMVLDEVPDDASDEDIINLVENESDFFDEALETTDFDTEVEVIKDGQ